MSRILTITAGLLLSVTIAQSDDRQVPASDAAVKQYNTLIKEFNDDGEARAISGRFIALAEQYPKSSVAADALVWVVANVSRGKDLDRAITLLTKSHLQSERLATVCRELPFRLSPAAESLLRELRKTSPHEDVRAQAGFHLAVYLRRQLALIEAIKRKDADRRQFDQFYGTGFTEHLVRLDTSASLKEIEAIYEVIAKSFANVKVDDSTMGETARRQLYAIRHLSLGRTAPEISGQDVDGITFKLSDYRGKVVLLDFWGHW